MLLPRIFFEMLEERADQRRFEIVEVELERLLAGLLVREAQQQPERVPVSADRLRTGVALGDQTVGERGLKRRRERSHGSTSGSCSRRRLISSSSSGTAPKYQDELAGSTCPRNADSSGIRRSMFSPASNQSRSVRTARVCRRS